MHTLDELQAAKAALESAERRLDNYDGNNPNKYRSSVTDARVKVREIEADLKARSLLPRSEGEELAHRIDQAFPNADSGRVVEFEGKRYKRRYVPRGKSLSGKTVYGYDGFWDEVPQ
jgi:hypothetical protein